MHNCISVLGGRELQNSFILTQIKDCMVVMWDEGTLLGKCEKYTKKIQVLWQKYKIYGKKYQMYIKVYEILKSEAFNVTANE